jgi:transposase
MLLEGPANPTWERLPAMSNSMKIAQRSRKWRVVVLWTRGQLEKTLSKRCFLNLHLSLKDETLLACYRHRWSIEMLFERMEGAFSVDGYRVRSIRAIEAESFLSDEPKEEEHDHDKDNIHESND